MTLLKERREEKYVTSDSIFSYSTNLTGRIEVTMSSILVYPALLKLR